MSKVRKLPGSGTFTLPIVRGATVRLTPFRGSQQVLLELRGPGGGDLGAVVLNADSARLLADGLAHLADGGARAEVPPIGARPPAPACGVLGTTFDPRHTLAGFARLAVPVFADWCSIDLLGRGRLPRRLTVVHADASKRRAAAALARYPHDPRCAHPRSAVWSSGQPDLAADVPDRRLVDAARNAEHLAVLRSLRVCSSVTVALPTDGRVRGVMTFVLAESRRHYRDEDLPLALTLARCAARAADQARLYAEAHAALRPRIGISPSRAAEAGRTRRAGT